jgi:hypothetical protein
MAVSSLVKLVFVNGSQSVAFTTETAIAPLKAGLFMAGGQSLAHQKVAELHL